MAVLAFVLVCVAVVAAAPAEKVLSRLNDGPRYQYVNADGAPQLADTWLTTDSLARAARYVPDTDNIYHLFSRQNPTVSQPMVLGWLTLLAENFDPRRPTVFLIHGWSSGPTSNFSTTLVPSILEAADVNVIVVDWSAGAYEPNYYAVVANNVPAGGRSIGIFIVWLNDMTKGSLDSYRIIGFEVGAIMAGVVGRTLRGVLPYITALEPPSRGFNLTTNYLSPSDAVYTECIHTNAGVTGLMQQVADVDFYPNGGSVMAGCESSDWECSRDRAFAYMAESIVSGGFTGTRCDSVSDAVAGSCESETTLKMGGLTAKTGSTGIYYLATNEQSPYSTG